MNEPNSGADPFEIIPAPMSYKDRSTGLVIFGCMTIVLGLVSALFVPLMLFGQAMAARNTGAATPVSAILPGVFIYGILAVVLVWLGIGSMMARRWARALLLIFSWGWLVIGVFVLIFMMIFIPKIMGNLPTNGTPDHRALPGAAIGIAMVVMFLVFGVVFVILPAVWTYFYQSRHVKATCETRDPEPGWTDACPLPVLALCLWALFSMVTMLIMPIAGHGVTPFFGMFLTGWAGGLFYLILAGIWGFAAWLLYRMDQRGWWLILIAICVFMVSALLTYAQHDVTEMYRLMGYPEAQIEQIQKSGLFAGNGMFWITLVSALPFLGFLFYVKKFLRPQQSNAPGF